MVVGCWFFFLNHHFQDLKLTCNMQFANEYNSQEEISCLLGLSRRCLASSNVLNVDTSPCESGKISLVCLFSC